jgi:alpha-ketoglutaric semialdehyde dehydrogenase
VPRTTETAAVSHSRNFIGGEWRESLSGATYEKRSPWRPEVVTGVFAASTADDARAAVEAAQAAFPGWAGLPAPARAAYFHRAADAIDARLERIAEDMTAEMGKPLREARMEAARAASILRYSAGEAFRPAGEVFEPSVTNQTLYTRRRPLGVVALITPWNFPIAIPVWKLAPALVYGNTVVLKLGYEAPRTGLHVAECFAEAGLPPGVLNVLTGSGSTAGAELVSNPGVRAVSFTGSVAVGEALRDETTARGCRVQLELGGHNPLLVMADAELDRAVEGAFAGAFWAAGQKCTATRRIYVHTTIADAFTEKLLARIAAAKVGDPGDPATEVGPVVNESAMEEILAAIERGVSDGGTVLAGGGRVDDQGYLIAPTLLTGVPDGSYLSCQEVFGPVTSLFTFETLDEALERANAVEFGLSAAVYTRDLHVVQRFADELQAGILHVNSQTAGADVHVPFGGLKGSGWGPHEQGRAAREFYTETVTVYQDAPLGER